MTLVRRVARPLLATVFITGGLDALRHPAARAKASQPIINAISGPLGLPDDPELIVRANGASMILGGAMLATGRLPRIASTALAASLLPTTVGAHAFWNESDPQKRKEQQTQFAKNLSLLGGVLLAAVDTSGKPGLAYRARSAARTARREAQLKIAQAN